MKGPWTWVRERAGLEDLRLHDLCHQFASVGVSSALSLPAIGRLLGHLKISTTERYSHLADDPVRTAAETIGETLRAAMDGRPKAEVTELVQREQS